MRRLRHKLVMLWWVLALRSGKYAQGFGSLCDNAGRYCCLGVLTDLYVRSHRRAYWWTPDMGPMSTGIRPGSPSLPPEVVKWAGLTERDPIVLWKREAEGHNPPNLSRVDLRDPSLAKLSTVNDDFRWDFRTIARLIWRQL